MDTTTLNVAFLTAIKACAEAIEFVERNRLTNFPLSKLDEIKGDFCDYVNWITEKIKFNTYEFNEKGLIIKHSTVINAKVFSSVYEYNAEGNETYNEDSNGFKRWTTYDEKGLPVLYKNSLGSMLEKVYDEKGNLIKSVNKKVDLNWQETTFYVYDENNNLIIRENDKYSQVFTYDKNNRLIAVKGSEDCKLDDYTLELDEKGNILAKTTKDSKIVMKYDANNHRTYYSVNDYWQETTYDSLGNIISKKNSRQDGSYSAEYYFYENGQLQSICENGKTIIELPYI